METRSVRGYGIIPFIKQGDEWNVFLINQYGSSGDIFWTFPKGHREKGESPEAAAKRELFEETNISLVKFAPERTFIQTYSFMYEGDQIDRTVEYFIGVAAAPEFKLQEAEIKEGGWFSLNAATERLTHDIAKEMLADAVKALTQETLSWTEVVPAEATLYFDADCKFCQACVAFVRARDHRGKISCVPLQGSGHDTDDACYESILFVRGTHQSQYSRAVIDVLWTLGGFWWLTGWLMWLIPRPLRDFGYRFVGRHRYLITGQKNTCDS